ncbi:laccase, partial [Staphylococcus haemolyticus]
LYPESSFNMARYVDDNPENITKHQEMLADAIGFERAQWVFPIQTHENRVMEISQSHRGTNIDTLTDDMYGIDEIYTYDPDTLLTMCYADCVPVYFYSEKHHYVGLAHAGWRGTYGQIVSEMLKQIDFDYNDLKIVIGPSTST